MSINITSLMGRLTRDPELKTTGTGKSVCSFCIAVDDNYNREETDFINIVTWNKTAEFVSKYFNKGAMIALTGRIKVRTYQNKDGENRTVTEVIADQVSFCGKDSDEPKRKKKEPEPVDLESVTVDQDGDFSDDLPF